MIKKSLTGNSRKRLSPLPSGLIRIYGLLAVLIVVIPEWLAELTLTMGTNNSHKPFPFKKVFWNNEPELLLSSMSIKEMRKFAKEQKLLCYSNENRQNLTKRLLKKLKK